MELGHSLNCPYRQDINLGCSCGVIPTVHPKDEEISMLRAALRVLADAADVVGVKYFDTDTMDPEVEDLQAATLGARALLNPT